MRSTIRNVAKHLYDPEVGASANGMGSEAFLARSRDASLCSITISHSQ